MRHLLVAGLLALALTYQVPANAQTVVLACPGWWGASGGISQGCTGCSAPIWTTPDASDEVKTDANQFWAKLGGLASTAHVITNTAKAEGSAANCADSTNVVKTVADLSAASTTPSPPTSPSPTGEATITWGLPLTNTDGSALTNLAGFRVEYGQGGAFGAQVIVGPGVTSYKFVSIAPGTWQARIVTLSSSGESVPSNAVTFTVTGTTAPAPVDCIVSAWSDWVLGAFGACVSGTQSRTDTRTRVVLTPAANGGTACPSLSESRTVSQACVVEKQWKVAPNSSSTTRPSYEAVLSTAGSALTRGNQEGTARVGATCGSEVFQIGTNSYRRVDEANLTLTSPTYKGRVHVTICTEASP